MAIYEYRCQNCGKVIEEVTMKIDGEKSSVECPDCKTEAPKIISSGSFIVHGFNSNNGYAGNMR